MKPIETVYNGYRFRSRLEARWAVFFDALGIRYEYEAEGFDIGGEWYLPDFYLPEYKLYVEIKPFGTNRYETKCAKFRDVLDRAILLCCGDPMDTCLPDNEPILYAFDYCDSSGGCSDWACVFVECVDGDVVLTLAESTRSDREIFLSSTCLESPKVGAQHSFQDKGKELLKYHPTRVNTCALKARMSRFEHGEQG